MKSKWQNILFECGERAGMRIQPFFPRLISHLCPMALPRSEELRLRSAPRLLPSSVDEGRK